MELVSTEIPRDFFYTAVWLASQDYCKTPRDTGRVDDIDAISYISDLMSRYISTDRIISAYLFGNAETLSEKVLAADKASSRRMPSLLKESGDFALFSSGMFPERLAKYELRPHYEKQGAVSYFRAFKHLEFPTLEKLAYRFRHFEGVITNARNNYMKVQHKGNQLRIVPLYDKMPSDAELARLTQKRPN